MAKHRLILVAIVVIGLFKVKIIFRSHQEQRTGPVRGADPLLRGSLTQRRHAGAARRPAPKQAPFFPSCPGLTRSYSQIAETNMRDPASIVMARLVRHARA